MTEEQQAHDWRGVPIEVGAVVVYPSRQSSSTWMNEGVVETVEVDRVVLSGEVVWKIGVRGLSEQKWGRTAPKSGRIAYPRSDRLTVVGRPTKED